MVRAKKDTYRVQNKIRVQSIVFSFFIILLYADILNAHNLWIVGDPENKGSDDVHLYFEHYIGPGDGSYNGPIEERGKTWIREAGKEPVEIEMKEVGEEGEKYLAGKIIKTSRTFSVDHTSLYGIYHGRLDFFHGRYIESADPKSLETIAESPFIPFQIVPVWKEKRLLLRVMYFSKPYPKAKLTIVKKDGTETNIQADQKGEVLFPVNESCKYHISALLFENEAAGVFEYQAFKGIMHGTTLTIKLSTKKTDVSE